jgi:hypothetical protein
MDKNRNNEIFKILAGTLPVLIVLIIVVGGVLLSGSASKVSGFSEDAIKTEELTAVMPKENEKIVRNRVTVSAGDSTDADKAEQDTKSLDELTEDYILASSNTKALTDADIAKLSLQELNYARNEIYARHGRKFDSKELQEYFESKSWYVGKYEGNKFDSEYSAKVLSDIEKKNVTFLQKAENKMSSGGYELNQ